MSSHLDQTITDLQNEIRAKEDELNAVKQTVNMLCIRAGRDELYTISNSGIDEQLDHIKSDTFYGQPLNSSVRKILEMRKAAGNGPAKVREIFDALCKGGYEFDAKSDENAMRGLRISLGKSSRDFHKLPNGEYGMTEWYPAVKNAKTKSSTQEDNQSSGDDQDGGD